MLLTCLRIAWSKCAGAFRRCRVTLTDKGGEAVNARLANNNPTKQKIREKQRK
jgi:hypothetical protein